MIKKFILFIVAALTFVFVLLFSGVSYTFYASINEIPSSDLLFSLENLYILVCLICLGVSLFFFGRKRIRSAYLSMLLPLTIFIPLLVLALIKTHDIAKTQNTSIETVLIEKLENY